MVSQKPIKRYKDIFVIRQDLHLPHHYFDVEIYDDGIGFFYMHRAISVRWWGISGIKDFFKRKKRDGLSMDDKLKMHELNFFFPYNDIKGVVADRNHKQIAFNTENLYAKMNIRFLKVYEEILPLLREKLSDKVKVREEYVDKVFKVNKVAPSAN